MNIVGEVDSSPRCAIVNHGGNLGKSIIQLYGK